MTAPSIFPCCASPMPMPAAITRKVPQKKESPIPESGPISPTFTLLMESVSKFSSFAFSSSIATPSVIIKGDTWGVMLNVSVWRFNAA